MSRAAFIIIRPSTGKPNSVVHLFSDCPSMMFRGQVTAHLRKAKLHEDDRVCWRCAVWDAEGKVP